MPRIQSFLHKKKTEHERRGNFFAARIVHDLQI